MKSGILYDGDMAGGSKAEKKSPDWRWKIIWSMNKTQRPGP